MFERRCANSRLLSVLAPVGSPASVRPPSTSAPRRRPSAPGPYAFLSPLSPRSSGPSLYLCSSARSRSSSATPMPRGLGVAPLCLGGWLAAGWHIVPTVLICCQAPFHLHFTPLSHSVCLCHSFFTPAVTEREDAQNKGIAEIKVCFCSWVCFRRFCGCGFRQKWSEWKLGQSGRGVREKRQRGSDRSAAAAAASRGPARPNSEESESGLWCGESVRGKGRGGGGGREPRPELRLAAVGSLT